MSSYVNVKYYFKIFNKKKIILIKIKSFLRTRHAQLFFLNLQIDSTEIF